MNLKEFFRNLKQFYNESSAIFEKCFDKYAFENYDVSEYEKVYVVEDSFVVYLGIKQTREITDETVEYYAQNNDGIFSILTGHLFIIEELTYNQLFKINATKLKKEIFGEYAPYAPYIYKFFKMDINKPIKNLNFIEEEKYLEGKCDYYKTNFYRVNRVLPFLKLQERYESLKGFPQTFILYEVDYNGKKGYAIQYKG